MDDEYLFKPGILSITRGSDLFEKWIWSISSRFTEIQSRKYSNQTNN